MLQILALGFRNLRRNRRRSIITASVIAIGCFSLILTDGFVSGFLNYMIEAGTSDFYGHGRIRHPEFERQQQHRYVITNPETMTASLQAQAEVAGLCLRAYSTAMISSAEENRNIELVGLDFQHEPEVSRLHQHVISGKFLSGQAGELLIGERLARRLNVGLGDKVVLTTTTAIQQQLTQELLRVSGIYSFSNKSMDEAFAFINLKQAQDMLQIQSGGHEIAIRFRELSASPQPKWKQMAQAEGLSYQSWQEFLSPLYATAQMTNQSMLIVAAILALLIFFTVSNTLYMSLYERLFEFGVLRAIGTSKSRLLVTIVVEALCLSLVGLVIAALLMATIGSYLALYGVDYSGMSYNQISLRDPIYFEFKTMPIILYSLLTVVFVGLISLYPAVQILRIKPAEALRIRN